jgi:hypothetical protein
LVSDFKKIAPVSYQAPTKIATEISADYPAHAIANRFSLTLQTARLVCELASIGGRFA